MANLGVFFAIEEDEVLRLKSASDDDELKEIIEEIETEWDEEWIYETDKAWYAMHHALSVSLDAGDKALDAAVLGGMDLNETDDYYVILKTPAQCAAIAQALSPIGEAEFRAGFNKIDSSDYSFPLTDMDFDYTWGWFEGLADYYKKVALAGRSVIFTLST